MTKTRRIRYDRIFVALFLALILFAVLVFGMYKAIDFIFNGGFNNLINSEDNDLIVNPEPIKTNDNVKLELDDYAIYIDDDESLGFNFIIATIDFNDDEPVSFDLSNLQTSEKIYLNDVASYLNKLKEKSYDLTKLNIVTSVSGKDNNIKTNIFIPYTTDSYSLRLLNSLDASMIEFDLSKNNNNLTSLKFETEDNIDVKNNNISVSSATISTMMLHNDEEYQIPSTISIYTFRIYVSEIAGEMVIEEAKFVKDNSDEVIDCLGSDYESVKIENIIGKKLELGENGALFFETINDGSEPDFSGYLMLKFSDRNEWVKVPTGIE